MDGAPKLLAKRRHKLIRLEFAAELKRALGEDSLCFSVDTKNGRVAVKGWKDSVDLTPEEAITWLEDFCAAFLYTHVDTEGTMQGFPLNVAATLRACTANNSSSPAASSRAPKWTRWMRWAWMPLPAWLSTRAQWTRERTAASLA